jgi:hypothetical protein
MQPLKATSPKSTRSKTKHKANEKPEETAPPLARSRSQGSLMRDKSKKKQSRGKGKRKKEELSVTRVTDEESLPKITEFLIKCQVVDPVWVHLVPEEDKRFKVFPLCLTSHSTLKMYSKMYPE